MVGKTKPATAAEKKRMKILKENVPCIPCLMIDLYKIRLPSIQHTVSGMKRDGHSSTYSACEWHHFGTPGPGLTTQQTMGLLGPSIAQGKRGFTAHFGPEALLVRIATYFVDAFQRQPWIDYNVPFSTRQKAREYWLKKQ